LKKFREYTYGHKVTIITDNHGVCSLRKATNPKNARIARWNLEVQDVDLIIKYKKGSLHSDADCLSRLIAFPSKSPNSPTLNRPPLELNHLVSVDLTTRLAELQRKDSGL